MKMLQGLLAVLSTAGFFIACMSLEAMPWQSFIIGIVCGLGMIKSFRALGVLEW